MNNLRIFFISLCFLVSAASYAQSEELAKNYFEQGEYKKALNIYEKLYKDSGESFKYFYEVVGTLQELEKYSNAEELIREKLNSTSNYPQLLVELGHNFELQKNQEEAEKFYAEALKAATIRPNYAFMIAKTFQKYVLLEEAIAAYEMGMEANDDLGFQTQLARLYGELGQIEKMFSNYIDLLEKNPGYFNIVSRYFNQFLTEDPSNEANVIFKNLLLKKLQSTQNIQMNEMLSWLFVQQKEYKKAFIQEKAIFKRKQEGFDNIIGLAIISKEEGDFATATEILNYIIEESTNPQLKIEAHQELLNIKTNTVSVEDFSKIENEYLDLFNQYGYGEETLSLQIDFANFLAFKMKRKEEAIQLLRKQLNGINDAFKEAALKMALGDILVLNNEFNQALIYYSQVQGLVKNDILAQNARFRVAKTSYYKGDFEWAKTQLDVLKTSTSQLIANDAMELSLLISDNSAEDSTQTALKMFAKADLFGFQKKEDEAIALLKEILAQFPQDEINDDALLRLGEIYSEKQKFDLAREVYEQIIAEHSESILMDDALFALANLYEHKLGQPEKSKALYEEIIFNHSDSIFFVEAQKAFRQLRGDIIN
ncbi:MAG TPA: tetratricopeptide repeat protein [Salinimicrobium sp.]|nr:tetratricopeptide repeat protein [Salinimicrobium sp.]